MKFASSVYGMSPPGVRKDEVSRQGRGSADAVQLRGEEGI